MAETYLARLKKLFFHPKSFFSSVEKDRDYSKIMFFYFKIVLIAVVLNIALYLAISLAKNTFVLSVFGTLLLSSLVSLGFSLISPFVYAGITHLGVLIFKGRQGYYNTYKASAYPLAIYTIYGIISTIVLTIFLIIYPLDFSNTDALVQNNGVIAYIILAVAFLLVSLVHSIAAQTIGISKFQKISKLRAFLAVILIPLILTIIALLLLSAYADQIAQQALTPA